jgi:glycosyltransferase involved in cell wall biosynthesis
MKICHVVTLLSADGAFGGPTSVAWQQALSLAHRGNKVTLLCGWDGRAEIQLADGVDVLPFRARQLVPGADSSGLCAPSLCLYLLRYGRSFDVLHIHLARDLITLTAAQIASASHLPYVVQTHGMIGPDQRTKATITDTLATRRTLRKARRLLFLTDEEQDALKQVAHGFLPLERLKNGIASEETDALQEGNHHVQEVLFCARLHPRKRVLAFADMAAELLRRGVDASFVVVGPDEGDLTRLQSRIRDTDLRGRLAYEGALPPVEVRDRLRRASVYVLPSENEPFPMTVLEAMSVGTPAVLTDSCHIATELHAQDAALVTDGSPEGLADAVQRLLIDSQTWKTLRAHAFDAVRTTYSIDAVGAQLEATYRSAISGA